MIIRVIGIKGISFATTVAAKNKTRGKELTLTSRRTLFNRIYIGFILQVGEKSPQDRWTMKKL